MSQTLSTLAKIIRSRHPVTDDMMRWESPLPEDLMNWWNDQKIINPR